MSALLAFLVTHHDVQNSFTLVLHVQLDMKHLCVVTFKTCCVFFPQNAFWWFSASSLSLRGQSVSD